MYRYYEYTDQNGKRWGCIQNAPGGTRQQANALLAHTARVGQWKDVEVFPENMPEYEIKKRVNAVQHQNGNPPIYPDDELVAPELKPASIIITDHAEPGANQQVEAALLVPTSPAKVMNPPILPPSPQLPNVPIIDHAEPTKPVGVQAPVIIQPNTIAAPTLARP